MRESHSERVNTRRVLAVQSDLARNTRFIQGGPWEVEFLPGRRESWSLRLAAMLVGGFAYFPRVSPRWAVSVTTCPPSVLRPPCLCDRRCSGRAKGVSATPAHCTQGSRGALDGGVLANNTAGSLTPPFCPTRKPRAHSCHRPLAAVTSLALFRGPATQGKNSHVSFESIITPATLQDPT